LRFLLCVHYLIEAVKRTKKCRAEEKVGTKKEEKKEKKKADSSKQWKSRHFKKTMSGWADTVINAPPTTLFFFFLCGGKFHLLFSRN